MPNWQGLENPKFSNVTWHISIDDITLMTKEITNINIDQWISIILGAISRMSMIQYSSMSMTQMGSMAQTMVSTQKVTSDRWFHGVSKN